MQLLCVGSSDRVETFRAHHPCPSHSFYVRGRNLERVCELFCRTGSAPLRVTILASHSGTSACPGPSTGGCMTSDFKLDCNSESQWIRNGKRRGAVVSLSSTTTPVPTGATDTRLPAVFEFVEHPAGPTVGRRASEFVSALLVISDNEAIVDCGLGSVT